MYCNNCGKALVGAGVFCQTCGARVDAPEQPQQPVQNAYQPQPIPHQPVYQPVQDFAAQIPATKTACANPTAWLLLVTAISWVIAAVASIFMLSVLIGEEGASSAKYVFIAIAVLNLIAAVTTCLVWQKGGRRLAKTLIVAAALGVVFAALLCLFTHQILRTLEVPMHLFSPAIEGIRAYALSFPIAAINLALGACLIAYGRNTYFIISRAIVLLSALVALFVAVNWLYIGISGFLAFGAAELGVLIINIILVATSKNRRN